MEKQSYFHFGSKQNILFSLPRKIFTTGIVKAAKQWNRECETKGIALFPSETLSLQEPPHYMHEPPSPPKEI